MGGQILKISIFSLFLLSLAFSAQTANPGDVIINEIAWMGTQASYNDEWIELRNNTGQETNLEGWILKAADGTPEVKLTGSFRVNGFYLLERTDDNAVPNTAADQIYTGALGNSGEILELYDNLGNLIDSVDASAGWPAGDNSTKQTMERKSGVRPGSDPLNWGTSQNPGGTPKVSNSVIVTTPLEPEPAPELAAPEGDEPPTEDGALSEERRLENSRREPELGLESVGVIINEILPSPTGPDEEEEWIEILNQNNFGVNLSGWQITDTKGSVKIYTFPEGTKIGPKGFLVLSRPTTKITLNNGGDGLLLIQSGGNVLDKVNYKKAPRGQSYNRLDSGWAWGTVLTPGSANIPPPAPAKSQIEKSASQKELAAVNEQMPKNSNASILFLVAMFTSLFGGVIILILKRKLKLG